MKRNCPEKGMACFFPVSSKDLQKQIQELVTNFLMKYGKHELEKFRQIYSLS